MKTKISKYLTSPPPATGWTLDESVVAVVRRHAKAELRSAAVEVPDGTFEIGPVGLQAVDGDKLRPVLNRLQQEVEGSNRVAVVVPTAWLRTHLLELENLPRRQSDLHEVIIWRLKKLLPVAPASLRLATIVQPAGDGDRRVLVLVGVERALADLEAVFESAGVSPGLITPRIFAVTDGRNDVSSILSIQQEAGFLSIMLLVDDSPRVVRTKPLVATDWAVIERELGLTVGFIESTMEVEGPLQVGLSAEDPEIERSLKTWIADRESLAEATTASPSLAFDGTAVRDRVGAHRLDPVVNILSGGVR